MSKVIFFFLNLVNRYFFINENVNLNLEKCVGGATKNQISRNSKIFDPKKNITFVSWSIPDILTVFYYILSTIKIVIRSRNFLVHLEWPSSQGPCLLGIKFPMVRYESERPKLSAVTSRKPKILQMTDILAIYYGLKTSF